MSENVIGEQPEKSVTALARIDHADLIRGLCEGEDVVEFILALDAEVADYEWTVYLRDRLNEVIASEDKAAEKAYGNPTEEFLKWLVRMDDPADEQGCKDRQVVTLTAIISRARNLLGGG